MPPSHPVAEPVPAASLSFDSLADSLATHLSTPSRGDEEILDLLEEPVDPPAAPSLNLWPDADPGLWGNLTSATVASPAQEMDEPSDPEAAASPTEDGFPSAGSPVEQRPMGPLQSPATIRASARPLTRPPRPWSPQPAASEGAPPPRGSEGPAPGGEAMERNPDLPVFPSAFLPPPPAAPAPKRIPLPPRTTPRGAIRASQSTAPVPVAPAPAVDLVELPAGDATTDSPAEAPGPGISDPIPNSNPGSVPYPSPIPNSNPDPSPKLVPDFVPGPARGGDTEAPPSGRENVREPFTTHGAQKPAGGPFQPAVRPSPLPAAEGGSQAFDFHPAPAIPPPLRPVSAPVVPVKGGGPESWESQGLGLVLGGAFLVLLGIFMACRIPLLGLDLQGSTGWVRQKLQAALLLHTVAALTALTLGMGSLLLRRWAPPLILSLGWLAVFTASLFLAVAGIFLGNEDGTLSGGNDLLYLIAGLAVPLLFLFYYEKESPALVCAAAHPTPAWTGDHTIPGLMVLWCGYGLAAGAGAMLFHEPALPVPPETYVTGPAARLIWMALLVLGLGILVSGWLRSGLANWLLLAAAVFLGSTVGLSGCMDQPEWQGFLIALGRPPVAAPASPMLPWLFGLSPLLLLLVFAMARRAFASPPPP